DRLFDERNGGVRAHPTGVGSGVVVIDTLEVLRETERQGRRAVGERERRDLPAAQMLLDDDGRPRVAKLAMHEGELERPDGLVTLLGDHDALALGEPVDLHDIWGPELVE